MAALAVDLPTVEVRRRGLEGASEADWDAVAIPVAPSTPDPDSRIQPRAGAAQLAALYGIDLADLADLTSISGRASDVTVIPLPRRTRGDSPWDGAPRRLVLLGVGDGSTTAMRTAGATLARACASFGRVLTSAQSAATSPEAVTAFVEGALLAAHVAFTAKATPAPTLSHLGLAPVKGAGPGREGLTQAVERAIARASGTAIARTLAATPTSIATSEWLAQQAEALGEAAGLEVAVHDRAWLTSNGFGGVLAVGAGASTEPRFVVLTHDGRRGRGRSKSGRTVAVVGKGIAYDTGGLDLKPSASMDTMKTDMTGAAVALGAVVTAARLGVPHRVVAVLPLVENAFSGSSYHPGDVVTVFDGTTVEIGNTDAEGRMVLADGIGWAVATLEPDVVVDVATLTGAATAAFGRTHAALYATTDELAAEFAAAAGASGERVWRMPLVADYRDALHSDLADVNHITTDPHTKAGSVTAALFLQRFAGEVDWVHLDIAGVGRSDAARAEIPQGATGFGVRLLADWLGSLTA